MSDKSGGWPIISSAGIAAVVVYLIFALVAFLKYPGAYGPLTNWLSDLGNPLDNPSGAIFYRLGCVLSGAALILFYLKLGIWNPGSKKTRVILNVAQCMGVFSAVCLIITGILPLGTSTEIHFPPVNDALYISGLLLNLFCNCSNEESRFQKKASDTMLS